MVKYYFKNQDRCVWSSLSPTFDEATQIFNFIPEIKHLVKGSQNGVYITIKTEDDVDDSEEAWLVIK